MDVPTGTVNNYRFSFYSPSEIRALSVLEVANDAIFDNFTGRVIDRGLHDLDMGPCTDKDLCVHCGFDYLQCPGHIGHIEFSKPVYNPLMFDLVVRLLKSFCFKCFRINEVPTLVGCLKLLGFPETLLPYQPKQYIMANLIGLPASELRKLALKEMTATSRTLCKRCNTMSWMSRHLNHQQIEVKPAKETKGRINRAAKKNEELEETFEPGEVEVWAEIEALTNSNAPRPVVTFEEGVATGELDDLLESVRERLKKICPNTQKFGVTTPDLVRDMLRCVWMQDSAILRTVLPFLNAVSSKYQYATDVCFMDVMPVSPNICRWPKRMGGTPYESSVTALLSRVLTRSKRLKEIYEYLSDNNWLTSDGRLNVAAMEKQNMGDSSLALTPARSIEALNSVWVLLQAAVNGVYDMTRSVPPTGLEQRQTTVNSTKPHPGFKQLIDKKEGWFRARIMGKRVQFSCRSVISPDPNLCVHEVGVPLYFAQRLYFPERVTAFNIDKMRALVIAGPDKYPGALAVELPDGKVQNIPAGDSEDAVKRRLNMAQRLVTPQSRMHSGWPAIVRRHLEDGDFLLMNRQPTLHKPSMQAHKVRVIKAPWAKTLRLHYAICKAYNADFDGDEMNGHFPQSYQAKAELAHLSAVPFQYLAPKDGTPLAGLIQDHVIASVKLTMRDRFLTHDEYLDLVYVGIIAAIGENGHIPEITLMPPAIIKPQRLWTGKQVISTLLMNITPGGLPFLNHFVKGKNVKVSTWVGSNEERARVMNDVDLVIVDGYMASGMLDKAHIGSAAGGLVHSVYEAYGPHAAAQLLSGISRLADRFLKSSSFTMSLADIMLNLEADMLRKARLNQLDTLGYAAFAEAFNVPLNHLTKEKICDLYRKAHFAKTSDEVYGGKLSALDQALGKLTHKILDNLSKTVLPNGLYKEFPLNSLLSMVVIGSKGGMVNATQMTLGLGQIDIEGHRVGMMVSGRTLPCFPPYDIRPRAGGYCSYRFLTSMPPAELFFHSMAGRDGLIDTACKTSRSGYLQRSVTKHLEDVVVTFDGTVRDGGNNVIQFRYGDDGLDPCQAAFLKKDGLEFFAENAELLASRWSCPADPEVNQRLMNEHSLAPHLVKDIDEMAVRRMSILRESVSKKKLAHLQKKAARAKSKLASTQVTTHSELPEAPCKLASGLRTLVNAKIIQGQAPPGEPVGLLASQSMGEPSTQMTLNTFHHAGKTEMNVTLGIPRLRELLMTGSADIATPCMIVPIFNTEKAKADAEEIARHIYRLRLAEVIDPNPVVEMNYSSESYSMQFNFLPPSSYKSRTNATPAQIIKTFEKMIFPQFSKRLTQVLSENKIKVSTIKTFHLKVLERQQQANDVVESEEPQKRTGRDEWGEDDGAEAVRRRRLEAEDEEDDAEEASRPRRRLDDEDDDEIAELRELGLDPEAADAAAEEEEVTGFRDDETEQFSSTREKMANGEACNDDGEAAKGVTGIEAVELERDEDTLRSPNEDLCVDPDYGDDPAATTVSSSGAMDQARVRLVKNMHVRFTDYAYDTSPNPSWVRLTVSLFNPEGRISVDLRTLMQDIISRCVMSKGPDIKKSFIDKTDPNDWVLRCEGVDFKYLFNRPDVFDLTRVYSNHIQAMQDFFGIEAARATVIQEVNSVFGHYGIHIDSRHFSLVGDYLTNTGVYRAFNRRTMEFKPSPMQQTSFETATSVLKKVIQEDMVENTKSPSAQIVTGQLTTGFGTSCFDLFSQLTL